MENDKIELPGIQIVEYTIQMMYNDIMNQVNGDDDRDTVTDRSERECIPKWIVMQMLLYLASSFSSDCYTDVEKLRNAIRVKVDGDELLSGFLFFVSHNPQFGYSWNYLRKRRENYQDFLVTALSFLYNVIIDINVLAGVPHIMDEVHVVFQDFLDVARINRKPYVSTRVLWDHFDRIAYLTKDYTVTIKNKESILIAGKRKEASDAVNLIDKAIKMMNDSGSNKD